MKCYKCGRGAIESQKAFYALDPKGKNRRWACSDCMTSAELAEYQDDIVDIILKDNKRRK